MSTTSYPCAAACVDSVARMSSASYPSASRKGIRIAVRTSLMRPTWPENSLGEVLRFALYSA
jgi:hypothetical protein